MADDCNTLITDEFSFPRRPYNRPGLARIAYRIGEYPDLREAMFRAIDREIALSGWTHRGADDPAIALLEGAAIVGDILSFYQEHYANEAYLRTATWRESIAELVRLTGYRLAPGVGGRATLAVEVKPGLPVMVPKGFAIKADLLDRPKTAKFQTDAPLEAWPELSKFSLYRNRSYASAIPAGADQAEIATVQGRTSLAAIAGAGIAEGDRLMLLSDPPVWEHAGARFSTRQIAPQIVEVKTVETVLGRTIVTFETTLERSWATPVKAYRLGRTFRHFGQAAAATFPENITDTGGKITGSREKATGFLRHVGDDHACASTSTSRDLPGRMIPLDQEVTDIMQGTDVIVQTRIRNGAILRDLTVRRRITRLVGTSLGFGLQNAPVTLLIMGHPIMRNPVLPNVKADVRDYRIHEVTSPAITLRPVATMPRGGFGSGTNALSYYGSKTTVRALAGRRVTLSHQEDDEVKISTNATGQSLTLTCVNTPDDFTSADDRPQMWPLSFDAPPAPFLQQDFPEIDGGVAVYGNLVEVSEGEALPIAPIGSGDGRAIFQTFKLPKPLTYHLSAGATPPQVPDLSVYVENRAWARVPSLFGQPADAQVYVVREDDDATSWVQFGDGKTGARLPSGKKNVSAGYRTGTGARGPLKPGADPAQINRIATIRKLAMPEGVHGGADREEGGSARLAAPGKVQGLGRLVSIADYETELMTIPGVSRVRADWEIDDGVPGIALRVLMETGRMQEFDTVRDIILHYQKCRGPNRHPVFVQQAFRRQLFLDLRFGLDPRFIAVDIEAAIVAALAPMDDPLSDRLGLFAMPARRLGAPEFATRVEGIVNNLDGVTYAQVSALGLFSAALSQSGDPLTLPAAPRARVERLSPAPNELLALRRASLTLVAAPPDVSEDCA